MRNADCSASAVSMEDKNFTAHAEFSCALEIKSLAPDGRFAGYASVFDVVDSQRDVMKKGAFVRTLKDRLHQVQLLWQHQWENPIGAITQLFEDANGLYIEGKLLMEVARAREAYALLKAGVLRGLSIGYSTKRARRDPDTGVRELLEVELWEISLVTLPANAQAQVTVLKAAQGGEAALLGALERAERIIS